MEPFFVKNNILYVYLILLPVCLLDSSQIYGIEKMKMLYNFYRIMFKKSNTCQPELDEQIQCKILSPFWNLSDDVEP
uniref:Uncharacterized protein n=1 Tax=Romanomermis culicivorax TaxID=13658 RepID=A0A915HS88_ROMCU